MGSVSDLWLVPLGIGAGGAVLLLISVKRLETAVAGLRDSMRPLRVDPPRGRDDTGAGAL